MYLDQNTEACGHPTRAGTPCKNRRPFPFAPACPVHLTEQQARGLEYALRLTREYYDRGVEDGKRSAQFEIRQLKASFDRQRQEAQPAVRLTYNGGQVVQVGEKGITYVFYGSPPLSVGDWVTTPANDYFPEREMRVSALGSAYVGELRPVSKVRAYA